MKRGPGNYLPSFSLVKFLICVCLIGKGPAVMSQEQGFDIGNFSFSFAPKILKDGSINDMSLGLRYTEHLSGELRLRYAASAKNEALENVKDSLNAANEHIFEVFALPVKYTFYAGNTALYAGGGAYYEYDNLTEKGFFNMPELENLAPPKERVNSYTNEFSMHIIGPLVEAGAGHRGARFGAALSGGIAPVFFLSASQKMSMVPLLDPGHADFS
jgi:hypothetical protein